MLANYKVGDIIRVPGQWPAGADLGKIVAICARPDRSQNWPLYVGVIVKLLIVGRIDNDLLFEYSPDELSPVSAIEQLAVECRSADL